MKTSLKELIWLLRRLNNIVKYTIKNISGFTLSQGVVSLVLTCFVPNFDISKHFSPRPNNHIVSEGWVPLFLFEAHSSKGHTLVKGHILTYLGGLSDDNAHPVIDEQALAYFNCGVDLDPR